MQPVKPLGPRVLTGRHIVLEPLAHAHYDAVKDAAKDPAIWAFTAISGATDFEGWWARTEKDTASGSRIAFAVRRLSDNAVVGSTSYLEIVPAHGRVEIGWTFYRHDARGTAINPEAKYLLMAHAFACGFHRVELKTGTENARSRAAIKKLGAKEEGILRQHQWIPHREYWRDTVYYSVLENEWPAVKAGLEARIGVT